MTKMPIVTALLKRNVFFSELIRLLQDEGIKVSAKKDDSSLKKVLSKPGIVLLEIDSENKLKTMCKDFKIKNNKCEVLCVFREKYVMSQDVRGVKTIYQPIIFNEFLKTILNLKRTFETMAESINLKNLVFYPKSLKLVDNDNEKTIKLTELENKLIKFIIQSKGGATKADLLLNVWKHKNKLDTHTLESLIYRLRRKIEKDPNNPEILKQVNKKYFLNIKF